MVAAPGDLVEEVAVVRSVIQAWNSAHSKARQVVILPVDHKADTYPEASAHPQTVVNRQLLKDCDILIAAFWTRFGQSTPTHDSGTQEEIDRHVKANKPALLYFSNRPQLPDQVETAQLDAVRAYKKRMSSEAYYREFDSVEDLRKRLTQDLAKLMSEDPYVLSQTKPHRTPTPQVLDAPRELTGLARNIVTAAGGGDGESEGRVLVTRAAQGTGLMAGRKELVPFVTGRKEAEIESAVEELEAHGLVRDPGGKREVFFLTKRGYDVSSELSSAVTATTIAPLSTKARLLLFYARDDPKGEVFVGIDARNFMVVTNKKNLVDDQREKTVSAWQSALAELRRTDMLV